ncbi:hypothetical protein GW923_02555 [Candidatus Pacearchaeota archaeon]|nr:hypothetical protein [Candidatus Pacearchaeota archaeon]
MKKEDAGTLFQLNESLKEAVNKLGYFYNKGDKQNFEAVKQEILAIQGKIDALAR